MLERNLRFDPSHAADCAPGRYRTRRLRSLWARARDLQSDRKTRQVSQPRMLAMFLARKYTPAAYQEIGEYFGNRRHSTVISAEKTVSAWIEENARLQLARGPQTIRDALRHVEANLHVG